MLQLLFLAYPHQGDVCIVGTHDDVVIAISAVLHGQKVKWLVAESGCDLTFMKTCITRRISTFDLVVVAVPRLQSHNGRAFWALLRSIVKHENLAVFTESALPEACCRLIVV